MPTQRVFLMKIFNKERISRAIQDLVTSSFLLLYPVFLARPAWKIKLICLNFDQLILAKRNINYN